MAQEKGRERARIQAAFIANPFGFTRKLLGSNCTGHLTCSKDEVDQFLHTTLHDPMRDQKLEQQALINQPALEVDFSMK